MKMTRKVLVCAVAAVALVAGLTSCGDLSLTGLMQKKKAFGSVNFKYSDSTYAAGNGTWVVDETNTSTTEYVRGGQLLLTKHTDIAAVATIKAQEAKSYDGVIGVLFDVTKHKDADKNELYDMIIAGVRNNAGTPQYYVSYFANVKEADLGKPNLGAVKADGKTSNTKTSFVKDSTECYEIPLNTKDGSFTKLTGIEPDADGNVVVVIDVDEDKDGNYTVKFLSSGAYDAKKHTYKAENGTVAGTCTIDKATIGKEEAAQAGIGAYATVYKAAAADTPRTLKASLEIMDLTNGALAE